MNPTFLSASFAFLDDLKNNNHREWFAQQRERYEALRHNYLALAESMLVPMQAFDATLEGLSAKNCIFRINRDVRFSADKSPYKTYLGFGFAPYNRKKELAIYYTHIERGLSFAGGGLYQPAAEIVKKIRQEIDYHTAEFFEIVQNPEFVATFGDLDREEGQYLKTQPKGYDKNHPALKYLQLKSFTALRPFSDKEVLQADFVEKSVAAMRALQPLLQFLNRAISE
ncbi:DUF2461 domain-containing protein [Hugenholtzia roseola]|uniref:DUF2461 domain-containing protein n=1 Tax=Hugenholtzia roseola TaxID=1002 RepID=UPI00041FC22D|nr:DUF2461 domain-containing protein [Hugenholtzia roseola]